MRLFILPLLFALAVSPASAQPITPGYVRPGSTDTNHRTWTSSEGRKLLAELTEVLDDSFVLVTPNKDSFTVPLSRLSQEDREYIERWLEHRIQGAGFFEAGIFSSESLPESAHIAGVEHVAQRWNHCATASAEMLLRFYEREFDQKFLARISSEESRRGGGTGIRALSVALRNIGLNMVVLRPTDQNPDATPFTNILNGIKHAIAQNRPVTMTYRVTGSSSHMVVVVGYDDRRRALYVLDPAGANKPARMPYKFYEDFILAAMVPFPLPATASEAQSDAAATDLEFLRRVSDIIMDSQYRRPYATTLRLREAGIAAEMRDVNRLDARSSQGLTRSFARAHGVEFVKQALDRGNIVLAPQSYDRGDGLMLITGHANDAFQGVAYFGDGTFARAERSALEFSLNWMDKKDNLYLLYIVEISPPASGE